MRDETPEKKSERTLGFSFKQLFEPHTSVTDPVQRRTAYLMALFHFSTIPLAPLGLFLVKYTKPSHVPMDFTWVLAVLGCTILNYTLARSAWYRLAIYGQVIAGFATCFLTAYEVPSRQSLHFLVVLLPTLMAAYLMSFRELQIVAIVSFSGLLFLYLGADADSRLMIVGSSFSLIVLIMLVLLIRNHQSWVEMIRRKTLKAELDRFQSLMQAAYESSMTLESGSIVSIDSSTTTLFGRRHEQLVGRSITDFVALDDLNSPHFGETSYTRPDGKVGFVLFAVEPTPKGGALIAFRDVTEERLKTVQQLQLDRMTQTATLAAGIAHEFNTPLMVIMHQLSKVDGELSERDSETASLVQSAQVGLQQLADIVKDLKWFIEPSQLAVSESPTKIIENAVRLASHSIRHQSEIVIDAIEEYSVAIQESQLTQLILNLLFNANEAKAPDRDRSRITVSAKRNGDIYVVSIQDDGVGMSEFVQTRALQPFFTHGKVTGTGLGLAICSNIVSQAAGTLDISSIEGVGTTVTVSLPVVAHEPLIDSVNTLSRSDDAIMLVVDDDELLGTLITEMLDDEKAMSFTTIADAIRLIKSHNVDLILCDLNMPNGGAQALYKHLNDGQQKLADRMIVMTGGAVDPSAQAFLNGTDLPILYKPFGYAELTLAINRLRAS